MRSTNTQPSIAEASCPTFLVMSIQLDVRIECPAADIDILLRSQQGGGQIGPAAVAGIALLVLLRSRYPKLARIDQVHVGIAVQGHVPIAFLKITWTCRDA